MDPQLPAPSRISDLRLDPLSEVIDAAVAFARAYRREADRAARAKTSYVETPDASRLIEAVETLEASLLVDVIRAWKASAANVSRPPLDPSEVVR